MVFLGSPRLHLRGALADSCLEIRAFACICLKRGHGPLDVLFCASLLLLSSLLLLGVPVSTATRNVPLLRQDGNRAQAEGRRAKGCW
jgi:hypothetical protein